MDLLHRLHLLPPEADSNVTMLTIIADKLSAAGWSWDYCSAVTEMDGVVDAHKNDGKGYIVQPDKLLSAFLELERVTVELVRRCISGSSGIAPVLCSTNVRGTDKNVFDYVARRVNVCSAG